MQKSGYIFVYQDVRGRWMSEGDFQEMRPHIDNKKSPQEVDDASDTYDTIEFLLKNVPNNNGKVGHLGNFVSGVLHIGVDHRFASRAGGGQPAGAHDGSVPGRRCVPRRRVHAVGQLRVLCVLPAAERAADAQSRPRRSTSAHKDTYKFYLQAGNVANLDKLYLKGSNWLFNDQMKHDTYDAYWKARDLSQHMKNVHCAVLVVGGWYDAEDLSGPYRTFYAINKFNPETPTTLVEGPWVHGGWARGDGSHLGDVQFNAKTSEYFRANIQFPFFEHYLKGKGAAQPKAVVFETGTNVWRSLDSWPPKQAAAKTLYFHAGGKLAFDPPEETRGVDEYVSDPNHPVPFVGYTTDTVPQRYMVDDQRFASYRPDVLVYETDPLEEDVTIAGPISPKLRISSSGTDSDFVVKLIDVYPENYPDYEGTSSGNKRITDAPPLHMGGYQQLLRGEPFRAKFRNSWEKPEPLSPGKITDVNFTMPDLYHTFRRGHRIMVQVQSSWFPLTDRNPQTFTDIPTAKPEDFQKATERVFRQKDAASGVEVLVMP